jgi:hypothetical protein
MKKAIPAIVLFALILLAIGTNSGGSAISFDHGREVVVRKSAMNRQIAQRDAERRLGLISLPPGAVPSEDRPSDIGDRLSEPGAIPGGARHVSEHRFWTVPGAPHRVYAWLADHPPRGSSAAENYADQIFWEHGPPGTRGATGIVTAVRSSDGSTAVRADVFTDWELPRNPAERVPSNARYLSLEVVPEESSNEGGAVPPVRRASTERQSFITALVRLVNRQPAFQLFNQPSCGGAPGLGWKSRRVIFRFEDRPHGRVLAQVSQRTPIGICDALNLKISGRKLYSLEGGQKLIHRAHNLIRRARPEPTNRLAGMG